MKRLAPTPEIQKTVTDSVPLDRWGTPMDIASAVMYLASPLAAYVTGAVILVDGGWSLGGVSVIGASMVKLAEKQGTV